MAQWVIASVVLKLSVYLTSAAAIGGIFSCVLVSDAQRRSGAVGSTAAPPGTLLLCILGLLFSSGYFFVRVGDFAGGNVVGMFDPLLTHALWDSPVGSELRFRLAGFTLAAAVIAASWHGTLPQRAWQRRALFLCYGVAALLLALAFSVRGHSAEQGLAGRIAVTAHVMAALWWAGSLYPLWRATGSIEPAALRAILGRFGALAGGPLLLLVPTGGALLYLLVFAPPERVADAYAASLTCKLALVGLVFGIAALNKWRFVPRLLTPDGLPKFRRSLAMELTVMVTILALTALFTTVVGPVAS